MLEFAEHPGWTELFATDMVEEEEDRLRVLRQTPAAMDDGASGPRLSSSDLLIAAQALPAMAERNNPNMLFANFNQDYS